MKTLIIIANPNPNSFTHAMANHYAKKCEQHEILDLYTIKQEILEFESTDELKKGNSNGEDIRKHIQQKITENDELAFFFPVWWGSIPAILKNFFDANFSAGFAFEFVKGKNMPKQLLTQKTAKIFATCDAPGFVYKIPFLSGINLKKYLKKSILGFCGITTTDYTLIGSLRNKTQQQREEILNNI